MRRRPLRAAPHASQKTSSAVTAAILQGAHIVRVHNVEKMVHVVRVADAPPYTVGAVNLVAFVLVIAMTLMTAPLGVRLAHAMDPRPLKRVFAVFLTVVALNMIRKALGY